jgi:hypothetical protein
MFYLTPRVNSLTRWRWGGYPAPAGSGGGGGGVDVAVGPEEESKRMTALFIGSTTSIFSNLRRKSIPTRISVFSHSMMIRPILLIPAKCISPRHVNLFCLLPSASSTEVVPLRIRPTGNASMIGKSRKPLKPVSTIAVILRGEWTGPETSISITGDPLSSNDPVVCVAPGEADTKYSSRPYFY